MISIPNKRKKKKTKKVKFVVYTDFLGMFSNLYLPSYEIKKKIEFPLSCLKSERACTNYSMRLFVLNIWISIFDYLKASLQDTFVLLIGCERCLRLASREPYVGILTSFREDARIQFKPFLLRSCRASWHPIIARR